VDDGAVQENPPERGVEAEAAPRVPARAVALGVVILASLALAVAAVLSGWATPRTIRSLVARAGPSGMLAYVLGTVAMELLFLPRAWGLLAGGMLFGALQATGLSLLGDLLGATVCYLLARGGGREVTRRLLERRPRAARVIALLAERRGLWTVAVLRVCPVAHYTLVSYGAGLVGVRPAPYLLGTAVGLIPAAILYPFVGHAALEPRSPVFIASLLVLVVGIAAALVATRRLLRDG
jgi:uncharacterized membrane protein YdjX (TVP38/TMEM64 family)